jgi:Sulfotransferase family
MLYFASVRAELHLGWRAEYPQSKVIDLRFDEIVDDEVGVARKIYAFLGMEFTASAEANVLAWLERDAKRGYARNTATVEDFGMSTQAITDQLSGYIERYGAFI